METNFVHLHLHTHYSILDGIIKIPDLISALKEKKQKAVAVTDHGNLFGMVEFYRLAFEAGIKPIIGCEVYLCPDIQKKDKNQPFYHLVLLARNNKGLNNLIKLVSLSYTQGFYWKPRIDYQMLEKYSEGLIALSACLQGEVSKKIISGDFLGAEEAILRYQKIFGHENFYLELMDHNLPEEKIVNEYLVDFSAVTGAKVVVTNDVHFLFPEDYEAHRAILALKTGEYLENSTFGLNDNSYYLKSYEELKELFPAEYLKESVEIAKRCNVILEPKMRLPSFPLPHGEDSFSYLKRKSQELWKRECEKFSYSKERKEKSQERLEYELEIIGKMGFSDYFLIVADLVSYAKREGIMVGPGRGSAAGSYLSYLLGITKINPLDYDLLFERFLNPQRISMPDIDIDFSDVRRKEVINYVKNKYGREKVAQIITFGKEKARNSLKDVCRVLKIPYSKADELTKVMPKDHTVTLTESYRESEKFRYLIDSSPLYQKAYQIALKLEGVNRNISTHAAGVVVSDKDLMEYVPLYKSEEEGEYVTQFDKDSLEYMGLLKMDFLGLKTLSIIEETINLIKKYQNKELNIDTIPLDDEKTFSLLSRGESLGVFQLENSGMMDLLKRYRPSSIDDIVALVALWRPGPLRSGMVDEYIERKEGKKGITYLHPDLEEILKPTYGVIIYQEQVMQIASKIGGFTMAEADFLRKAMSKKKEDYMVEMRQKFVAGAQKKGISTEIAEEIFSLMAYFSGYGFNKSHSVCYGYIAYQTAFLKANYPLYFMCSLLNSEIHNSDKINIYCKEAQRMGIEVLPPSINFSSFRFEPLGDNKIVYPLAAIKNVGEKAAVLLVEERRKNKYKDFYDFLERIPRDLLNVKLLESLLKAGVFKNDFKIPILGTESVLDKILLWANKRKDELERGQISFFDLAGEEGVSSGVFSIPQKEYSFYELLQLEKEYLGIYLSGHPLEKFQHLWEMNLFISSRKLEELTKSGRYFIMGMLDRIKEKKTRQGKRMAFAVIEDLSGKVEVIFFPEVYQKYFSLLDDSYPLVLEGLIEKDRDGKFIVENVWTLPSFFSHHRFKVNILISSTDKLKDLWEKLNKLNGNNGYVIISVLTKGIEIDLKTSINLKVTAENLKSLVSSFWSIKVEKDG